MKLPDFDYKRQQWDAYKTFHVHHGHGYYGGAFVQFATGELIVALDDFRPDRRRYYRDFDISVYATTDDNCPALYHKGEKMSKAALNVGGGQLLLIDHGTKRAVKIYGKHSVYTMPKAPLIPKWLWSECYVYFAGPGCAPAGSPITISPTKKRTAEQWRHVHDLQLACDVWRQHEGIEGKATWQFSDRLVERLTDFDYLLKCGLGDLNDEERNFVAGKRPFKPAYDREQVDYLEIA